MGLLRKLWVNVHELFGIVGLRRRNIRLDFGTDPGSRFGSGINYQRRRAIEALEARAPQDSLQNRVNSITLRITLNAKTGKIVLVTQCIQFEWLFCNVLDPQNVPKSLAAGASPQTPLGELTALPQTR